MHHFAEAITATAGTVLVYRSIVALVFGLTGLSIHLNVIHLHITATLVIGERNRDFTCCACAGGVVLHTGGQGPGLNGAGVDTQADGLLPRRTARADNNGAVATARTTAA